MKRIYDVGFGTLVICAVVLTGVVVLREFSPRSEPPLRNLRAVNVEDWDELLAGGHRIGPSDAAVTIVEFADFECPACKVWNTLVLPRMLKEFEGQVALVYRHWPLGYHAMAYPAARAAECAALQGMFGEYHDSLFAKPSLSVAMFDQIASEIRVSDMGAFQACRARSDPVPSIERGIELATRLGGAGTPSFAVNGRFYPGTPSDSQLDSIVRSLLAAAPR